ncbi:hypothetical protein ES703_109092 [subsurface metagenome]
MFLMGRLRGAQRQSNLYLQQTSSPPLKKGDKGGFKIPLGLPLRKGEVIPKIGSSLRRGTPAPNIKGRLRGAQHHTCEKGSLRGAPAPLLKNSPSPNKLTFEELTMLLFGEGD